MPGAVLLPEEVLLADGGGEQEEQVQEEAGGGVLAVGGALLRKVMQVKFEFRNIFLNKPLIWEAFSNISKMS